jgi:large subunit ribosomal protein L1
MPHVSKKIKQAQSLYDHAKQYPLAKALELLAQFPKAKFDETVELSVHLGVDPKQSAQMVRGVVELPNGSGKKIRVAAFCEQPELALAAGADHAGLDDLIAKVMDGWTDFDVALATPNAMKELRKAARVLGPRGLMPNPKSGTVTEDIAAGVKAVKAGGRVEFKMDKTANIGVIVGKRSFTAEALQQNIMTVVDSIAKARPDGLKGQRYVKSMAVSGTMTPGVRIESSLYANL